MWEDIQKEDRQGSMRQKRGEYSSRVRMRGGKEGEEQRVPTIIEGGRRRRVEERMWGARPG